MFQSFNFCDISFRSLSLSFVSFSHRFFSVFYLCQTLLFPLSALLKWMNCRFEKYCCCHFALSKLKLISTQFDPIQTEKRKKKSSLFSATTWFRGKKNREAEWNKPKQRMAFISVFGLFYFFYFISPLCRAWIHDFVHSSAHCKHVCVCVCADGNRTSTFYTFTMIFMYVWN